eukprot:816921-Pelagomonas_calceolata.AAC.5
MTCGRSRAGPREEEQGMQQILGNFQCPKHIGAQAVTYSAWYTETMLCYVNYTPRPSKGCDLMSL